MDAKEMLVSGKSFVMKCKRVWQVLKKPTQDEFLMITKVSALGILIVGAIGFVVSIIVKMI